MVSLVLILACLTITIVSLVLMVRNRVRGARGGSSNTPVHVNNAGGGGDTQRLLSEEDDLEEDVVDAENSDQVTTGTHV